MYFLSNHNKICSAKSVCVLYTSTDYLGISLYIKSSFSYIRMEYTAIFLEVTWLMLPNKEN